MKIIMKTLIGFFALVLFTNVANAQYIANDPTPLGDGDNPYVGTEYTYEVTRGDSGSTIEWLVFNDSGMAGATDGGKYSFTGSVNNTPKVAITWNEAGTYYLTYKETLDGCSTYRGVVVIATANDFYLTLAADDDACNSQVNKVLDWTTYKNLDVETKLTYQVTMNKNDAFTFSNWEFDGKFTFASGSGLSIADISDVVVIDGTKSAGATTSEFSVSAPMSNNIVTITVSVSGKVTDGGDVTLSLTNGAAVTGTLSVADNTSLPASSDRAQVVTLKPLAGSSNISF